MLTTENATQIEQNIVTDLNANVLADEQPRRRTLSPEAAILLNASIVARPLMTPEVCSLRIKNTEYRYRWVNCGSRHGAMYMQRKAQGFTNATLDDAEVLDGDASADRGEIRAGDLILMKIRADIYDAALKYNMVKAQVLARTRGMYLNGASSDVMSDSVAKRETINQDPAIQKGKVSSFIPDPDKIEQVIEQSMKSGNDRDARETVKEIRANIAAEKAAKN